MRRGTRVGEAYVAIAADAGRVNEQILDSFEKVDYDRLASSTGDGAEKVFAQRMKDIESNWQATVDRMAQTADNEGRLKKAYNSLILDAFTAGDLDGLMRHVGSEAGVQWGSGFDDVIQKEVINAMQASARKAARDGEKIDFNDILFSKGGEGRELEVFGPAVIDAIKRTSATVARLREEEAKAQDAATKAATKAARTFSEAALKVREAALKVREAERRTEEDRDAAQRESVKRARDLQKRLLDLANDAHIQGIEARKQQDAAIRALSEKFARAQERLFERMSQRQVDIEADTVDEIKKIRRKHHGDTVKMNTLIEAAHHKSAQRLLAVDRSLLAAQASLRERDADSRLRLADRDGGGPDLSARIGKSLGEGSRMDAIHYFGKSAGNMVRMISKVTSGATGMFKVFRTGWKSVEAGASIGTRAMAGFGAVGTSMGGAASKALTSLAASLPVLAVALAVVTLAASALVTVLIALAGIVAALAASITSALTAALTVAAGALIAVAAAGGFAAAAFTSLSKAQKETLANSFKPVADEFKRIGSIVAKDLTPSFKTWGDNVKRALTQAVPLARQMGGALGLAGSAVTKSLSGPGWKKMMDALGVHLPKITIDLGTALGKLGDGLMGMFAPVIPYVSRFMSYLRDVTTRFSEWASSAAGERGITDFMDRAVTSLKSVWGWLKEVGGVLKDVLFGPAAQGLGNDLFDGFAESIRGWRAAIADGALERWMAEARSLATGLGEAMDGLKNVIKELNDPEVLDGVVTGLKLFGDAATFAANGMGFLEKNLNWVPTSGLSLALLWDSLGSGGEAATKAAESTEKFTVQVAKLGDVSGLSDANMNLAGSFDQITGAATSATRAIVQQEAAEAGLFASAGVLGISNKTLIDSMMGIESAQKAVSNAMSAGRAASRGSSESAFEAATAVYKLNDGLGFMKKSMEDGRQETLANILANRGYIGSIKALPKDVRIYARKVGFEQSLEGVERLAIASGKLDRKQIRILANASGVKITKKEIDDILGKIPKKVTTKVNVEGADKTKKGVTDVNGALGKLPPKIRPKMDILNLDQSVKGLKRVKDQVRDLGNARVNTGAWMASLADALSSGKQLSISETESILKRLNSIEKADPKMAPYVTAVRRAVVDAKDSAKGSRQVGLDLKSGLLNGMAGTSAALSAIMAGAVRNAIAAAKREARSKSPSRKTMELGNDLGRGLAIGMHELGPEVEKAGSDLADRALQGVSGNGKGGKGGKGGKKHKHPKGLKAWARSLIDNGPTMRQEIAASARTMMQTIREALGDAMSAMGSTAVTDSLKSLAESVRSEANSMVDAAQEALNTAARRLLKAKKKGEIAKAHKAAHKAEENLKRAQRNSQRARKALKILDAQGVMTQSNVDALLSGMAVESATLADYAAAREAAAAQLESANAALADAISTRDSFKDAVKSGIQSFGALTTAQASMIDGVEQALSASDITSNLEARLTKARKFQDNLRLLLASGLNKSAYKQLVEAGVDGGSAYAEALLAGGQGAITHTNQLVTEMDALAESLGQESSNHLYQAGVDAAQGLVDGLLSLTEELNSAATQLGNAIADAVKRALGIASPSRLLRDMMGFVGDGMVLGLDDQQGKVGLASERLAGKIAPSPEVAAYAAAQRGNQGDAAPAPAFRDLVVHTPTEDPEAVAMEVLNEVVGRL